MKGLRKTAEMTAKLGGFLGTKSVRIWYDTQKDLVWSKEINRGLKPFEPLPKGVYSVDVIYPKTTQQIINLLQNKIQGSNMLT